MNAPARRNTMGGGMPNNPGRGKRIKPCKLQTRVAAAWSTVAQFDAADSAKTDQVMEGARLIHAVQPRCPWRVMTEGALPVLLMRLDDPAAGWLAA